ncbi:helix-turn-helix domain-containing protein [Burkholderia vietnamiensis]|uniref:helix-turn-helix domain-containing protein n=1 Tax=Burkholderia vietnamiensis TaxID=60552 RepID=UPI001CF254D6|nr:helix-turn-helix domain-containing protein [Burkholderia vietnamiensis]MCA8266457.1 helix-turn-helix domain-containing protein [Burkholderia vietnamiensis]
MIVRSRQKDRGFYMLDNVLANDQRISWSAKGMLVFLLAKPDNWRVSVEALVNFTKPSARPTGRDGVYSIINELIDAGYMSKQKHSNGSLDYMVYDEPQTPGQEGAEPLPENPEQASPSQIREIPNREKPDPENPTLYKTDSKKKTVKAYKKTQSAERFDAHAQLVSMGVDAQVATDWLKTRKARKLAPTMTAFEGVALEADKAGITMADAVKYACVRGWGSFKADWLTNDRASGAQAARSTGVHSVQGKDYTQGLDGSGMLL